MIMVDDVSAVMTPADFAALPNYSLTCPTGVVVGKRWKSVDTVPHPLLGEYVECRDEGPECHPGCAKVVWRKIYVVD
jgi:hypothetical protein